MGYDDNTPLTGVTGGGLPTDIWREVMMRVHEGVPPRELPMQVPVGTSQFGDQQQQDPSSLSNGNGGGTIIDQVLRDIFGGNSGPGSAAPAPSAGDR